MYFCLDTNSLPKVSYMNRNVTPLHWTHPSRVTNEFILYIINHGTLYLKENSCNFELHAGDMFLLEPRSEERRVGKEC